MPSSTSSSKTPLASRGLPWALFTALALFFACECFLWQHRGWLELCARYSPPFRTGDPLRTEARIRLLPRTGEVPPVLLVGSSQILEGLECEPFVARSPERPCLNLGIAGGTPLDLLFLTDRIDRRVKRRTLITGVFPQTLHAPPKAAFSDVSTLRALHRAGSLSSLKPREWTSLVLFGQMQNLCATLRMKDALSALWDEIGTDPLSAWRLEMPASPPNNLDQKPPRPRKYFRQLRGVPDTSVALGPFTRAHERALSEVLDREVARGNRVIVVDFPTRIGYETRIEREALDHHRALLNRVAARGDVVVVRVHDLPPLSREDFHDFTHVRASGRAKLSERLAEILAGLEAGAGPPVKTER